MSDTMINPEDDTDLERSINCPVCFDYMLDSRTLYPCVHTFCTDCVSRLERIKQRGRTGIECPLCRGFVAEGEIRTNRLMNLLINRLTESGEVVSGDQSVASAANGLDSEELGSSSELACLQCECPQVTSRSV